VSRPGAGARRRRVAGVKARPSAAEGLVAGRGHGVGRMAPWRLQAKRSKGEKERESRGEREEHRGWRWRLGEQSGRGRD
jgi:hypothetical protein